MEVFEIFHFLYKNMKFSGAALPKTMFPAYVQNFNYTSWSAMPSCLNLPILDFTPLWFSPIQFLNDTGENDSELHGRISQF